MAVDPVFAQWLQDAALWALGQDATALARWGETAVLSERITGMANRADALDEAARQLAYDIAARHQVDEVVKVIDILKQRDVKVTAQTWNRRYREYMEKIKTGSVFEVAVVLRDLFLLKEDKDLSYGERKMLDTAKNLLVKEFSLAQQTEEEKIEKQIEKLFS